MLEIDKLIAPSTLMNSTSKGLKPDGIGMITPMNIAIDMINTLPDKVWNKDSMFIDIACKSGHLLQAIYLKLMDSPSMIKSFEDPKDRRKHIINNQLYGIALRETDWLIATRVVYGELVEYSHIIHIPGYIDRYISCRDTEGLKDKLKEKLGDMEFNVIVGNPPYNNDMYIDFVNTAKKLIDKQECDGNICMITPAKWQAKSGDKNDVFRKDIVPCMSDVIFYPDENEVFDIHLMGGITYYKLNKHPVSETKLTNIKGGAHNSIIIDNFGSNIILDVNSTKILNKVRSHPDYKPVILSDDFIPQKSYFCGKQPSEIEEDETGDYYLKNKNNYMKISNEYLKHRSQVDNYKVYCGYNVNPVPLAHIYKPNEVANRVSCLMGFGDIEKCESIKSYYETKLIWYLAYIFSTGTICTDTFRFVPDPFKFDHIFTDDEIYEKYGLTEEEIKIIESVIKDRK